MNNSAIVRIVLGGVDELDVFASEWSDQDVVIGVDRGAIHLLDRQIVPQVVVGDLDSVTVVERDRLLSQIPKAVLSATEKDQTDTEMALTYAAREFPTANYYFYNWQGGRVDHLLSILLLAVHPDFSALAERIHLIGGANRVAYYGAGQHRVPRLPEFRYVSVIALGAVKDLTIEGAKYPLAAQDFLVPRALVSNEFISDGFTLSLSAGSVAVVYSCDN